MKQMTTPTNRFTLPFSASLVSKVRISYVQEDVVVLSKTEANCTKSGNEIRVTLTQQETGSFAPGPLKVELRVMTSDGAVLGDYSFFSYVEESHNKEVL